MVELVRVKVRNRFRVKVRNRFRVRVRLSPSIGTTVSCDVFLLCGTVLLFQDLADQRPDE